MILLSQQDKDEIEIHIKSEFGVDVTIKYHDKTVIVYRNVKIIHWLVPNRLSAVYLNCPFHKEEWHISTNLFYWLSFEPSIKIQS